MRKNNNGQQSYYFSNRLKEQLKQISDYPLTVIEAPSGFGKTTAVREFLRSECSQAACEWYTCMEESVFLAWEEICDLFARINSKTADDMKSLKTLTKDTLFYVKSYLKNLTCRKETYLIVDNYHLINFDMHRELIGVFSMHENPNLHMVFVTQQLDFRQQFSIHNDNIHTIDASSFFFEREGIANLFRMEGFRLTADELDSILRSTEGWVSAIRLQMLNYKKTGSFVRPAGIEQLVEAAAWNQMLPLEKGFMLAVSVFDSFTAQQGAAMLDYEVVPGRIEEQLKSSSFVRYLPDKRLFVVHSILLDYLRNQFYYHQTKEYQNEMFRRAGHSCAAVGQHCLAAGFFYTIKDFDAILSLPVTPQYLDEQKEKFDEALFSSIMQACPEETLCRYPSTMIVFAHYAQLNGKYGLYDKLCRLIRVQIKEGRGLTQREVRKLTGEFLLLESLGNFNLAKMKEEYAVASEILDEAPDLIENSVPWLSVFITACGMFWHETGELDEILNTIDELKPIYRRFNQGQGAGLAHLVRAEVMLIRGEDNQAEILCHKTIYEARSYQQISICIHAELCLARIFVLRGDAENFFTAMSNIQRYAVEYPDSATRRMVDICMSIISLLLGVKDYVAPWLYDIGSIRKLLYAPVIPFAEMLYFRLLLIDRRYNELYAFSQLALEELRDPESKIKYIMPQVYYLIFLAVAKHNNGEEAEAEQYLKEALGMAVPDKVYLPFADHECMIELLSKTAGCPPALLAACKRYAGGLYRVKKSLYQNKSSLTPREREIALLAKNRLSAKEIGAKLYISEATVKSTLRSVYSKLGIHSRSELASIEF